MRQKISLHTGWTFHEPASAHWLEAKVPGCIHTDLIRHRLIPDPFWGSNELELQWIEERDWSYRCEFDLSEELFREERIDLIAEGLDTLATLRLNGVEVSRSANMFMGYRFFVKRHLRPGRNLLEIDFASPMPYIRARQRDTDEPVPNDPVGGCFHIRKEQCSFGWDWGPRFATCGIVGPIGLEAWSANRIERVRLRQNHSQGSVHLSLEPELAIANPSARFRSILRLRENPIAESSTLELTIPNPELWWPNTLGSQPLYSLEVSLLCPDGAVHDTWSRDIGLRTIELDCHPDEFGESFQFRVNGKPVFAKGANWVPAHSFVTEATPEIYENLIDSAARANMNMLRVWGGGIYETETFYDLCDRKGILVWQDFMFACALYPGTEEFLALVRAEAEYQVKRLSHRASLALWCGNNELEQMPASIVKTPKRKAAFEAVFYGILPEAVKCHDGATPYWPGSPHNPEGYEKGPNNENAGDAHFWQVWHARKPVKTYETKKFRFCSEFGMQSYSSPEVAATFCPPEQFNVFAPAMENHQKNPAGNMIILDYVARLYRFPKDYASLAYLSQLNQAYCMQVGVEHYRRCMPRTMGALYWQLNDCWPVFSWSSLEFGGNWKALHWAARRFFSPALVSAHIPGDETAGIANRLSSTVDEVHLYTIYDAPEKAEGRLGWMLFHLDGRILDEGNLAVELNYGESVLRHTLKTKVFIDRHGITNLILRVFLDIGENRVSQKMLFLTAPRFMELKRDPVEAILEPDGTGFRLELRSSTFHHQVLWHFPGLKVRGDDNYVDLYPGASRIIALEAVGSHSLKDLREVLTLRSLVDSYA